MNSQLKFKVLMSHRYGTRSLPTRIIAKEYDTMLEEIREHDHFDESEISYDLHLQY